MQISRIMQELMNTKILTDQGEIRIKEYNSVHSIYRITYLIMEKLSKKGNSKGVFVVPDLDNFFYFFGIFTALNYIIDQQSISQLDISNLRIGGKYKFFKNVFIYRGIETENNTQKLKAEFRDETYYLPIVAIPEQIVPVEDTTALTKLKQLFSDFNFSEQLTKNQNNDLTLSDILYKSLGKINKAILLIVNVNKIKSYFSKTFVDDKSIYELIKIGQIDKNGDIINQSNQNVVGNYSLIICSNMDFVKNSIKEGYKFSKILIDFDNFREFVQNDVLDFLHKIEMDIYIFKSFSDYKNDGFFENNDYFKWNWSNEYVQSTIEQNPANYNNLERIIRNQLNKSIITITVHFQDLTEVVKEIFSLTKLIDEMNSQVFHIYESLYEISMYYFRLSFYADEERLQCDVEKINALDDQIEQISNFLDFDTHHTIISIHTKLKNFLCSDTINNRITHIDFIANTLKMRSVFIVHDNRDKNNLLEYFSAKKMNQESIIIYSPNEFLKNNDYNYENVVVTSWLGRDLMQKILLSNSTANYTLLLTELELSWFASKMNYLNYIIGRHDNIGLLKTIGYEIEQHEKTFKEVFVAETEDVFYEFEFKASNRHYSDYSDNNIKEQVEAYPVRFSGEFIMFITEDWEMCVVTDIFNGQSVNIEMKNHREVYVNDIVLYHESNPDLIRSIADKDERVFQLRKTANIWKRLINKCLETNLTKYTKDQFQKAFIRILRNHGCQKHSATIKNWISNNNIIIPDDIEDIRIILKVFKKDESLAEDIFRAGLLVRKAHIQAGFYLSAKTNKNIKELCDKYDLNVNDLPIEVNDAEFGKVYYLKIDRIDSLRKINSKYIGRLLKENKGVVS